MEGPITTPAVSMGQLGPDDFIRVPGPFGHNYGAKMADISDGTAQTIMASEIINDSIDLGVWRSLGTRGNGDVIAEME